MTEEEISQWATKLIKRYDNVKITGSQGEWSGDVRQGFMFNPKPIIIGEAGPTPPPPGSGACCFNDGTCVVETEELCNSGGGTYQGDGTDCDPNPCPQPPTGACCIGTDCSIETQEDCEDAGGTYQGDDTTCDPNPCEEPPPSPCCGFAHAGGFYLTKLVTWTVSGGCEAQGPSPAYTAEGSMFAQVDIDPVTCVQTINCGGCIDYSTGFSACQVAPFCCSELDTGACPHTCSGLGGCIYSLDDSAVCSDSQDCEDAVGRQCHATHELTIEYSNPCTPI